MFIVTVFIVGNSQRMLSDDIPKVLIDGAELTLLASEPDIKHQPVYRLMIKTGYGSLRITPMFVRMTIRDLKLTRS